MTDCLEFWLPVSDIYLKFIFDALPLWRPWKAIILELYAYEIFCDAGLKFGTVVFELLST